MIIMANIATKIPKRDGESHTNGIVLQPPLAPPPPPPVSVVLGGGVVVAPVVSVDVVDGVEVEDEEDLDDLDEDFLEANALAMYE